MSAVLQSSNPDKRLFTLAMCVGITVVVFIGFSFTILPDVILRARPLILYVHVVSAVAWLLLLVVQASLVRRRQIALHRRLGVLGIWLGGLAAVSSFATTLVLRHEDVITHVGDHTAERIAFLSIPLNSFVLFSVYFGLAIVYRSRPSLHRRFILVGAAVLTGPALARIPYDWAMYVPMIVPAALVFLLCVHDYVRTRRVHAASWSGLTAIIALQVLTMYLYIGHPQWWLASAKFLIGV